MGISRNTARQFIVGDPCAAGLVFEEYKNLMYFVIASYVSNSDHCDDLLSESFIKIIQHKSEIKDIKSNYDLLAVVMVCLGGHDVERYSGLIKMLDVLLSQEIVASEKKKVLQEEFGIPMTRKLEGGLEKMCNLSKGVYNQAVDDITVKHIYLLMQSDEKDIEECLRILHVPEDKQEEYRKAVMEKLGLVTCQ